MQDAVTRYPAVRAYFWAGWAGLCFTLGSAAVSLRWAPAWTATGFLLFSSVVSLVLGMIPGVEIGKAHVAFGHVKFPWKDVVGVERLAWLPLILRLTLTNGREALLLHAGGRESRAALWDDVRRMARGAAIAAVPHREIRNADPPELPAPAPVAMEKKPNRRTRYPLLLSEDEAEVERLFQQLRTAGHMDPKNSPEEKT